MSFGAYVSFCLFFAQKYLLLLECLVISRLYVIGETGVTLPSWYVDSFVGSFKLQKISNYPFSCIEVYQEFIIRDRFYIC